MTREVLSSSGTGGTVVYRSTEQEQRAWLARRSEELRINYEPGQRAVIEAARDRARRNEQPED